MRNNAGVPVASLQVYHARKLAYDCGPFINLVLSLKSDLYAVGTREAFRFHSASDSRVE